MKWERQRWIILSAIEALVFSFVVSDIQASAGPVSISEVVAGQHVVLYSLDPSSSFFELSPELDTHEALLFPKPAAERLSDIIFEQLSEEISRLERTYYLIGREETKRQFEILIYRIEANTILTTEKRTRLLGRTYFLAGIQALSANEDVLAKKALSYYKYLHHESGISLESHPEELRTYIAKIQAAQPPPSTVPIPQKPIRLYSLHISDALLIKKLISQSQMDHKLSSVSILPVLRGNSLDRMYIGYNPRTHFTFHAMESELSDTQVRKQFLENMSISQFLAKKANPKELVSYTPPVTTRPITADSHFLYRWMKDYWYVPVGASILTGAAIGYAVYTATEDSRRTIRIQLPPQNQ